MHQPFLLTIVVYSDFTGILYVMHMCSYLHQHTERGNRKNFNQSSNRKKISSSLPFDVCLSIG